MPSRRYSGPLVPGTKSVRQVNRRPPRRKPVTTAKKLVPLMKSIALKQCETKRVTYLQENLPLLHNHTRYMPHFLATAQGLENPGAADPLPNGAIRVGNEIIARGISLKLWFENAANTPNIMYRIVLFKYPTIVGSVLSDNRFWQGADGNGSIMNRMIDTVATNRVKIIYSTLIKPSYPPLDINKCTLFEKYINLNNLKVKYNEDGGIRPMFTDIGLAIVPYNRFAKAQDAQIATFGHSIRVYFKDP